MEEILHEGRFAGLIMHPSSLPNRNGLSGDFGKGAYEFVDYLVAARLNYWQVLPLGPCRYVGEQPGCPYLATSTFAMNPLFVSVEALVEDGLISEEEVAGLLKDSSSDGQGGSSQAQTAELKGSRHVDYVRSMKFKEDVLALSYERFRNKNECDEYNDFCAKNYFWLQGYACFEALQARFPDATTWLDWPQEYKNYRHLRKDAALMESLNTAAIVNDKAVPQTTPEFHKFVQYKVCRHWRDLRQYANEREIKIFGDVAFYVNLHSSDVWSYPEMFQMNPETSEPLYVSGVPPDPFCADGQLWGHPVYDWKAHEKTQFRWWTKRIRLTFEKVDALRLDHFRGFVAYWRVPYAHAVKYKTASDGEWVEGPGEKLFDALYKHMGWLLPKKALPSQLPKDKHGHSSLMKRLRHVWGFAGHQAQQAPPPECQGDADTYERRLTYRGTAPMIVAEDLGFITEEIVILRDKYNILSMRVMQFAWGDTEKGPNCEHLPYNVTRNCCVHTGTHDNDTVLGWWKTASPEQKTHLTNYLGLDKEPTAEDAHWHLVRLAMETVAHLVVIPVQDVVGYGSEARFNQPGSDSPSNWSWQLDSLDELYNPPVFDRFAKLLETSGRVKALNDSFPK
ncbi:4-alpha-glucanotransferase [Toxoplasma gondii RUB]|uniref:4-alpha-glucanotransferase n=4 Tax=Toxoplasma gondii TaxID=5811 RepID=A0A2G8Y1Y9_TOXGO|nr:4-alpha-glucanotransferase [Toxoplasma gondii RUB]KFG99493.1 4-alpha-glucanotransferase [Toxoplasma gondii VAND]KFH16579.1 4-alpha-glucanotransferase [Toxoplasma gondii MAS]PIM01270.1 4-alpha-glucanotransferase [Toxoplasma gondii COUG]